VHPLVNEGLDGIKMHGARINISQQSNHKMDGIAITLWISIQEIPGLNIIQLVHYPETFHSLPEYLRENTVQSCDDTSVTPRLTPSNSLPVYHKQIIILMRIGPCIILILE